MNWAWGLLNDDQHKLLTNPESSQRDVVAECMNIDNWVIRSVMAIEGRTKMGSLQPFWTGFGNRVCKDAVQAQAKLLKPDWSNDETDHRTTYREWVKSEIDLAIERKAADGENENKSQGSSLRKQQEAKARKRREMLAKRTGTEEAHPTSTAAADDQVAEEEEEEEEEEENEGEEEEEEEEVDVE